MEELLKEAACLGNLDAVQKLLQKGARINAQHGINEWTALHWACKRSHVTIVEHLLRSGADVNLLSCKGESVADVTEDDKILKLLEEKSVEISSNAQSTPAKQQQSTSFIPHYLQYPPFPYYDIQKSLDRLPHWPPSTGGSTNVQTVYSTTNVPITSHCTGTSDTNSDSLTRGMNGLHLHRPQLKDKDALDHGNPHLSSSSSSLLVVKVRVCGSGECDFVEVEVGPLTYPALMTACCEELELATSDVAKIRKLPNILIRKDKDVQRMKDGQELELVLKNDPMSATV